MYFEREKFIPTLEQPFLDILEEILNCDHQKCNSEQGQGHSVSMGSSELNSSFRSGYIDEEHPQRPPNAKVPTCSSFHNRTLEMSYNHLTMARSPVQLMVLSTAIGICHTHLSLDQEMLWLC